MSVWSQHPIKSCGGEKTSVVTPSEKMSGHTEHHSDDHHEHGDSCPCSKSAPSPYGQTLDEMDFDRGLWGAVVQGDMDRIDRYCPGFINGFRRISFNGWCSHFTSYWFLAAGCWRLALLWMARTTTVTHPWCVLSNFGFPLIDVLRL